MKHIFQRLILLIILFFSFTSWSQQGKLRVFINAYDYYGDNCYQLTLLINKDTVHTETIDDLEKLNGEDILIDSLAEGMYFVNLENCGEPTEELFQSATANVEILPNKIAELNFYMEQDIYYSNVDEVTQEEIIEFRGEFQAEYSYFDFRWNPDGNDPKFNLGIGGAGYSWFSFSKHVGFLLGGGFGWNFAQLQIDEQTVADYPDEVKSNYYNYSYLSYDMKVRFSTLNQQSANLKGHNVFLDIGAAYHLPLYFKRVTRFNIRDKLVNGFIHRFSDVRLYANLGVKNFQVFASYRPFDFIHEDLPQFPRYNLGVKFNFPY